MTRRMTTIKELGWSQGDLLSLAVHVARCAAYQLAGDERGQDWREIASRESAADAIGKERWLRLAHFALTAIDGLKLRGETDENGPVIRVDEIARLGALVLVQFTAQA